MDTILNTIKSFAAPAADPSKPTEAETTPATTASAAGETTSHTATSGAPSVTHTGDAHAPTTNTPAPATTLPGSFDNDSHTPVATPGLTESENKPIHAPTSQTSEPHLPEMQTSGLGGALNSAHLTHLSPQVDADNASTTAVRDEPDSTSPEAKGAFTEDLPERKQTGETGRTGLEGVGAAGTTGTTGLEGVKETGNTGLEGSKETGTTGLEGKRETGTTGLEGKLQEIGLGDNKSEPKLTSPTGQAGAYDAEGTKVHDASDDAPKALGVMGGAHLNSSDNRGPSQTSEEQGPGVTSVPGKVGAFDAEGTKVHDATDPALKAYGVMGGAHLNSADNKPESAGKPLLDDQGANILGPGPAMTALPPTEPASTTDLNAATSTTPHKRSPSPSPSRSTPAAETSNDSTTAGKSLAPPALVDTEPTPTGRSLTPTPSKGASASDEGLKTTGLEKKTPSEMSAASEGGTPKKVGMGEKVKGLVTEMKGHVKKDPVLVEEGKAIRHGEAHTAATTTP